jgi:hypothetical protein
MAIAVRAFSHPPTSWTNSFRVAARCLPIWPPSCISNLPIWSAVKSSIRVSSVIGTPLGRRHICPGQGFRLWDKTEAAGDLAPLPAGEYIAHVIGGELFTSQEKGTPGYKLAFRVCEGEHVGRLSVHRSKTGGLSIMPPPSWLTALVTSAPT